MYRIFWNKNFDSLKIKSLLVLKTPLSQLPGQKIWVYRLQRTISLKIHLLSRHQENFLQWNWLKQRVNLSRNAYRLEKNVLELLSQNLKLQIIIYVKRIFFDELPKDRIPRQFEGWSWDWRNRQHESRTQDKESKLAAGSRLWTFSSVTSNIKIEFKFQTNTIFWNLMFTSISPV